MCHRDSAGGRWGDRAARPRTSGIELRAWRWTLNRLARLRACACTRDRANEGEGAGENSAGENGAGSVLAIGLVAGIVSLLGLVLPLSLAIAARHTVTAAADAGALAAADTAIGIHAGFPCARAAQVVEANGASLTGCTVDGLVATVEAVRVVIGISVTVRATAGPAR